MTTKYLAWKDANCNGNNIEWLELTGREFYALIKSPAGKGRYFIRLYDDIGFECNEIYIEATLSGYRNWRVDENAHNYLKRINKDYETFSLDAPIDSEENTLHDLVGCDQPSVEDEPLIDKKSFEQVKRKMEDGHAEWESKLKTTEKARSKTQPFFHNIIFCGDCGVHLSYTRNSYGGSYYCRNPQYGRCTGAHHIGQNKLKDIVWQVLKDQLTLFCDFEKVIAMLKETGRETGRQSDYAKEIQELSGKIKQRQRSREKLYEDYTDGILSAEDYMFMKQKFDNEYQELNTSLSALEALQAKLKRSLSGENRWLKALGVMKSANEFTPELLAAMVEKIIVYGNGKDQRIEVVLKYREDAETLLSAYNEMMGGAQE